MSDLDRFREEWRHEVENRRQGSATGARGSSGGSSRPSTSSSKQLNTGAIPGQKIIKSDHLFRAEKPSDVFINNQLSETDKLALKAFEDAVDREHAGKLSDAVSLYREAFRLNEKVDKLYREKYYSKHKYKKPIVSSNGCSDECFVSTFDNLNLNQGNEDVLCPLMAVPVEILSHILAILAVEDLSSFTKFTYTCKKIAYVAYTTENIWKHLCLREFEHQHYTPNVIEELGGGDEELAVFKLWKGSWRKMYLDRPRIRFNGIYISTCNYLRPGAGQTWSVPVHMVTYYRYCRFFEDGTCMNLLTTLEPADVVPVFVRQNVGSGSDHHIPTYMRDDGTILTRPMGITHGTWNIESLDGQLLIESEGSVDRYIFYMNLQIRSSGKNRHNKLKWQKFWSVNKLTQDHGVSQSIVFCGVCLNANYRNLLCDMTRRFIS
jgi:F-box protein 9